MAIGVLKIKGVLRMRTFVASLIVLLFCLPIVSMAKDETRYGQEAEDLMVSAIRSSNIVNETIVGSTFVYLFYKEDQLWHCSINEKRAVCHTY